MGFLENMMAKKVGKMRTEEKQSMMEKMMSRMFDDMTKEEKSSMMKEMMPKMMGQMMGGGGGFSMRDMMMGEEDGFNPKEMCKEMMTNMQQGSQTLALITPELRQLFEEWISEIEQEILDDVGSARATDIESIMSKLNLSKESVVYLIARLAKSEQLVLDIKKRSQ